MSFPALTAKFTEKVDAILEADLNVVQLCALLHAYADMVRADQPRLLSTFNFSEQASPSQPNYTFTALNAHPQLLVVNGVIVGRDKWAWNNEVKMLTLTGYSFPADANVELYYLPAA